jgi:hypothetical protein
MVERRSLIEIVLDGSGCGRRDLHRDVLQDDVCRLKVRGAQCCNLGWAKTGIEQCKDESFVTQDAEAFSVG